MRNADDLAAGIDQRPTRIARAQRDRQPQDIVRRGADDAQARRVALAHRVADGDDQVAHAQRSESPIRARGARSASTSSAARSSSGARRTTSAEQASPVRRDDLGGLRGVHDVVIGQDQPGRSQITPEPALPREPRTSTTLRATSRLSSATASETSAARASSRQSREVHQFGRSAGVTRDVLQLRHHE